MKAWQAIVGGGLTAGAVDIVAAMTIYHVADPARIFRSIAGGLIGRAAAHAGGLPEALLGAACHFAISLVFAAFYVIVGRRFLPVLIQRPWICGALYGVGVYAVMNYLVVPLSALHGHAPTEPVEILKNLLAMVVFGLIIGQFAGRTSPAAAPVPAVAV